LKDIALPSLLHMILQAPLPLLAACLLRRLQVTRELEKDIALAKQQLAQASNSKVERAQQYKLMLRTLECVTRWGPIIVVAFNLLSWHAA
jgi:hypothetical protein